MEQWVDVPMDIEKALPIILKIQSIVSAPSVTSTFEAGVARNSLKHWFSANFSGPAVSASMDASSTSPSSSFASDSDI